MVAPGVPSTGAGAQEAEGGAHVPFWEVAYAVNAPKWTDKNLTAVHFPESGAVGYAVGYGGTVLKTEDGGDTWKVLRLVRDQEIGDLFGVHFVNDQVGVVVGKNDTTPTKGVILRTDDGGDSWRLIDPQVNVTLRGVHFPTADVGYAVGDSVPSPVPANQPAPAGWPCKNDSGAALPCFTVLKSTDGGVSWDRLSLLTTSFGSPLYAVNFTDAANGVAVGGSADVKVVLKAVNGNWTRTSSSIESPLALRGVARLPNSAVRYAVGARLPVSPNSVLRSTDDNFPNSGAEGSVVRALTGIVAYQMKVPDDGDEPVAEVGVAHAVGFEAPGAPASAASGLPVALTRFEPGAAAWVAEPIEGWANHLGSGLRAVSASPGGQTVVAVGDNGLILRRVDDPNRVPPCVPSAIAGELDEVLSDGVEVCPPDGNPVPADEKRPGVVTPPSITTTPSKGHPGDEILVGGEDWLACDGGAECEGSTVKLSLRQSAQDFALGTFKAGDDGAFEERIRVPQVVPGKATVLAEGNPAPDGGATAKTDFVVMAPPSITVSPAPAELRAGQAFTVSGSSWKAGATIQLSIRQGGKDFELGTEVQVVTVDAASGSFTLTFDGDTTGNIASEATAETVMAALEALPNIGIGNVTVVGSTGGPYTVTFVGRYLGVNVPQMTADDVSLAGGGDTLTVSTTTEGGSDVSVQAGTGDNFSLEVYVPNALVKGPATVRAVSGAVSAEIPLTVLAPIDPDCGIPADRISPIFPCLKAFAFENEDGNVMESGGVKAPNFLSFDPALGRDDGADGPHGRAVGVMSETSGPRVVLYDVKDLEQRGVPGFADFFPSTTKSAKGDETGVVALREAGLTSGTGTSVKPALDVSNHRLFMVGDSNVALPNNTRTVSAVSLVGEFRPKAFDLTPMLLSQRSNITHLAIDAPNSMLYVVSTAAVGGTAQVFATSVPQRDVVVDAFSVAVVAGASGPEPALTHRWSLPVGDRCNDTTHSELRFFGVSRDGRRLSLGCHSTDFTGFGTAGTGPNGILTATLPQEPNPRELSVDDTQRFVVRFEPVPGGGMGANTIQRVDGSEATGVLVWRAGARVLFFDINQAMWVGSLTMPQSASFFIAADPVTRRFYFNVGNRLTLYQVKNLPGIAEKIGDNAIDPGATLGIKGNGAFDSKTRRLVLPFDGRVGVLQDTLRAPTAFADPNPDSRTNDVDESKAYSVERRGQTTAYGARIWWTGLGGTLPGSYAVDKGNTSNNTLSEPGPDDSGLTYDSLFGGALGSGDGGLVKTGFGGTSSLSWRPHSGSRELFTGQVSESTFQSNDDGDTGSTIGRATAAARGLAIDDAGATSTSEDLHFRRGTGEWRELQESAVDSFSCSAFVQEGMVQECRKRWERFDNDGDGKIDEDGDGDGDGDGNDDDDHDGRVDEDPPEGEAQWMSGYYGEDNDHDGSFHEDPIGDADGDGNPDDDHDGKVDEDGAEGADPQLSRFDECSVEFYDRLFREIDGQRKVNNTSYGNPNPCFKAFDDNDRDFTYDDDGDGKVDEDPPGGGDNDGDGKIDEDPKGGKNTRPSIEQRAGLTQGSGCEDPGATTEESTGGSAVSCNLASQSTAAGADSGLPPVELPGGVKLKIDQSASVTHVTRDPDQGVVSDALAIASGVEVTVAGQGALHIGAIRTRATSSAKGRPGGAHSKYEVSYSDLEVRGPNGDVLINRSCDPRNPDAADELGDSRREADKQKQTAADEAEAQEGKADERTQAAKDDADDQKQAAKDEADQQKDEVDEQTQGPVNLVEDRADQDVPDDVEEPDVEEPDASAPDPSAPDADAPTSCDPRAVSDVLARVLPQVQLFTPAKDLDPHDLNKDGIAAECLVCGTPGGAQAIVRRDRRDYYNELILHDVNRNEVPGLRLAISSDGTEFNRYYVDLAGVFAESTYYIGELVPEIKQLPPTIGVALVDTDLKPLAGGSFEVVDDRNGDGVAGAEDQAAAKCTTGSDGVGDCAFSSLKPSHYVVRQVAAPSGYLPQQTPVVFNATPGSSWLATFVNLRDAATVQVRLVDTSGTPLEGGEFELTKSQGGATPCATDGAGLCEVSPLTLGRYTLTQKAAPQGYNPADPVSVNLTAPGQVARITVVNGRAGQPGRPGRPDTEVEIIEGADLVAAITGNGDEGGWWRRAASGLARAISRNPMQAVAFGLLVLMMTAPGYLAARRRELSIMREKT